MEAWVFTMATTPIQRRLYMRGAVMFGSSNIGSSTSVLDVGRTSDPDAASVKQVASEFGRKNVAQTRSGGNNEAILGTRIALPIMV